MVKASFPCNFIFFLGLVFGVLPASAGPDVDFLGWHGGARTEYWQQRTELTQNLDQARTDQQSERRLDLVRFYLANRDAAEALGLLALFVEGKEAAPELVLYRGIAAYLQNRLATALKYLVDQRLESSSDAQLWRALVYARLHQWRSAKDLWESSNKVLWHYPPRWQAIFAAAQIETAFGLDNLEGVEQLLDLHAGADQQIFNPLTTDLFQGRLLEARGEFDAALEKFTNGGAREDSALAAEAGFRALALQSATGREDAATVRARLRNLSPLINQTRVARAFEQLKANLAEQSGEPFNALYHLRLARDRAVANEQRRSIQGDIDALMTRTLGENTETTASLITLVEGFYGVQDLLPLGAAGDQIVLAHADRLVALDLLKPAEELLAHQVAERLKGASRAKAALKLAEIRITRGDYARAQISLQIASYSRLGHVHALHVKQARARILAGRGDFSGAITVLKGIDWDPALKLRADLHLWQGQVEQARNAYHLLLGNFSLRGINPQHAATLSEPNIAASFALAEALTARSAPKAGPALDYLAHQPVLPIQPGPQDIDDYVNLDALYDVTQSW